MKYRVCKSFHVESGHMLSKHPGACRFPHGHTRRVDVVLSADRLDDRDMVCDFKAVTLAVGEFIRRFDHALAINSADAMLPNLAPMKERLIVLENTDPTTEVLAERIYRFIAEELRAGREYRDADGNPYRFPPGVAVESVRVTETPTSWAEVSRG